MSATLQLRERTAPPGPLPPASTGWRASLPRRGDPRIPFALILTGYAVLGTLWLGFNRGPLQILLTVASGCALDMLLHALLRRRELLFPLSAYISSLSIALLLSYSHNRFLLFFPIFLTIGSKYLFTFRGRHVFNPSLFGVAGTLLLAGGLITAAPAYQWGGTWAMSAFMVTAALALFVFRVGRGWLIVSFLAFYALQTGLRAYIMRAHLPPEMLFWGTLTTPPFFLFVFFMLPDPRTSPSTPKGQVALAFAITVVDLYLHTRASVFTFFYAAFALAGAKFLWLHGAEAWRTGTGRYLRAAAGSTRLLRTVALLGALAALGGTVYRTVLHPQVALRDAGFVLREIPASRSGLGVVMDPTAYDLVDPRLRHVAKWLLSVGASVAVGDVDGDGLPDLFFTHPLARPEFRTALYLNRGDFQFERVPLPALDSLGVAPERYGLASGGVFFDYDGDGAVDLLVPVSFGQPRLLRNLYAETGRVEFVDVSESAGMPAYTISVAANVLDFDRDGQPDLLIGNVLAPYLPGYADSVRLNIFRLPQPEFPGDRRMFRFMHDGWHNATNGGGNLLLRNHGDGTFQALDAAAMGMPETHWTLSIGTGDLNGDGWTDLYLASDFGRDDLYLNEGGRGFRRVRGRWFGEIGLDTYKGMNASVADFDGNERLDVYVSNVHQALQAEGSLLWMNRGSDAAGTPRFRDEATARGALNENRFGWGAGVGDLNNDGWMDIVQANGMVDNRLDRSGPGCPDYWYVNHKLMQSGPEMHSYADMWGDLRGRCIYPNEARRVYLNRGAGAKPQFVDVAGVVGLTRRDNSRGVALVDLDNDGRLDVVIANQHGGPSLLRNVPSPAALPASWIGLRLQGDGKRCNREALGSTVSVHVPGRPVQIREVQAANGFSAQHDTRVHFGLGSAGLGSGVHQPIPVSVRWCGGETVRYHLAPGRYHHLQR
ncbi:MAG: FG-GAP-like repeat-containing protein [Gemmatimonadota bacterium]|nr:FG-GAP-like repeat-containing protein [Gemmatimonadota bacterium]